MEKVRVAVIGCGYLGRWHVEKAISHGSSDLVAIVESSESGRFNAQKIYPNERVVSDIDEVLNEIDAVLIATPTSVHFNLVNKLIKAKKHVFCEKPLTDSLEDALKLNHLDKDGLIVQVGHSERFHPIWKKLKADPSLRSFLNSRGSVTIDRYAAFKGRATDVDVVSDLMIHDLDLLWFLFEEDPLDISATGHKINTNKWDHATAVINYTSGRRAVITSGRAHVEEQRKVQIISDAGALVINLMDQTYSYAEPGATSENIISKTYEKADHLYEEQDCFYKSILNQDTPIVSLEDGVRVVTWIDAVRKSLDTNKVVVLK